MRKAIYIFFFYFFLCSSAYAFNPLNPCDYVNLATQCHKDCGTGCPKGSDIVFDSISANKDSRYQICAKSTQHNARFNNATIGWGRNCSIPAGEHYPSQYSCISTGNVFGEVIDTITTLGIGIDMRENFCSFSPGNPALEGAIIDKGLLNSCNNLDINKSHTCIKCLLRGKRYDDYTSKCKECTEEDNSCLNVDNYIFSSSAKPNFLCNGIPNLEKPLLDDNENQVYTDDGIPVYCPITRCNIPTNDIRYKYHDSKNAREEIIAAFAGALALETGGSALVAGGALIGASECAGNCCDQGSLTDGEHKSVGFLGAVKLRGDLQGDRMCVQMFFPGAWRNMACKPVTVAKPKFPPVACFVKNTPLGGGKVESRWFLPLSSTIMQTVTTTFDSIFTGNGQGCQTGLTFFQNAMKDIVRLCLILYIIIFGIMLAMGAAKMGKRDMFVFILNFGLVIYFSIGVFGNPTTMDDNSNGLYFLRNLSQAAMNSFSEMMVEASNIQFNRSGDSSGLCDFSGISYTGSDGGDYSYLRIWDSLDCKIQFYLGLNYPSSTWYFALKGGTSYTHLITGIFNMLWSLFFSGNMFLLLLLFALGFFLLSLLIYFVHLYIIAMIAVIMMIFFGPIFVPMVLFSPTKQYFDAWLRTLIGHTIQPVVVIAIISFMIATFDSIVYSDCKFDQLNLPDDTPFWVLKTKQSQYCKKTYGYFAANFTSGRFLTRAIAKGNGSNPKKMYSYNITTRGSAEKAAQSAIDAQNALNAATAKAESEGTAAANTAKAAAKKAADAAVAEAKAMAQMAEDAEAAFEGLMLAVFFAFLFYFFAGQIDAIVYELTGVASVGAQAISPNAVTDLAINLATQGKFDKVKQMAKKMNEGKKKLQQKLQQKFKKRTGVDVSGSGKNQLGIDVSGGKNSSGISVATKDVPKSSSGISVSSKTAAKSSSNAPISSNIKPNQPSGVKVASKNRTSRPDIKVPKHNGSNKQI